MTTASRDHRLDALTIVVHDYSGHPFQLQLSRELARRGHRVVHQYSADFLTGRGRLTVDDDDPGTFSIEALTQGRAFAKYSVRRRIRTELGYGRLLAASVLKHGADVVIMCNVPLLAHSVANRILRRAGVPAVFWHQDVYSHAITTAATRRFGLVGRLMGLIAVRLESRIARDSAAVVPISDAFLRVLDRWGVPADRTVVIPNWGAVDELPVRPRDNAWARRHGLVGRRVALYAGTLGFKHNPDLLYELARDLHAHDPDARMVVISEGIGRDRLARQLREHPLESLVLLDFQPYESLPDVMGAADVLVAVLDDDASRYSVPSKILSYLCAGRPVLALIPEDNAAATTLRESGGGVIVPSDHPDAAPAALLGLLDDGATREKMGRAARRYAEARFDIGTITQQFQDVLTRVAHGGTDPHSRGPLTLAQGRRSR